MFKILLVNSHPLSLLFRKYSEKRGKKDTIIPPVISVTDIKSGILNAAK
jgi:hypothetical protein